jgi:hypothetical protein
MGFWTEYKHACKVSSFLHEHIFLYNLHHPLLILILEKVLIIEIHILPDHCVDLSERIKMKFSLHFSEIFTNFDKYLKAAAIFELMYLIFGKEKGFNWSWDESIASWAVLLVA